MYDLPSQENIEEVIIESTTVKGQSQPIIVHSKSENKNRPANGAAIVYLKARTPQDMDRGLNDIFCKYEVFRNIQKS